MPHTPGPWTLTRHSDREGGNDWFRVEGKTTLFLTISECSDGYVPGENETNAHLIAAAPDLLAVCEALVVWHDAPEWEKQRERIVAMAHAAIAKAKGETP